MVSSAEVMPGNQGARQLRSGEDRQCGGWLRPSARTAGRSNELTTAFRFAARTAAGPRRHNAVPVDATAESAPPILIW